MSLSGALARRLWRERLRRMPLAEVERRLVRRRGVVFLCYHSLAPELDDYPWRTAPAAFERHLAWLGGLFDLWPAAEAVAALRAGQAAGRARPVAVISFDDGYRDNLDLATPILERHGAPATLFAARGLVARGGPTFLDEAGLRQLGAHPLWRVGAHGVSHSALTGLHPDDQRRELAEGHAWLCDLLGRAPDGVAYPFGRIGPAGLAAARGLYACGFVTDHRLGAGFDPWQIRRACPGQAEDDLAAFARMLLTAPVEDGRQ